MKAKAAIFVMVVCAGVIGVACGKSGNSSDRPSVSSLSTDDRHKLFQAAGAMGDDALRIEVSKKLGLLDANGQPTAAFEPFTNEHLGWAMKNIEFIKEHMPPDKAKEYVNKHMPK
jgi:hypothetical protein